MTNSSLSVIVFSDWPFTFSLLFSTSSFSLLIVGVDFPLQFIKIMYYQALRCYIFTTVGCCTIRLLALLDCGRHFVMGAIGVATIFFGYHLLLSCLRVALVSVLNGSCSSSLLSMKSPNDETLVLDEKWRYSLPAS